ncbi:MAG TPA: PepSY domain-containing protein [Armatimonadota bacterium]|nr:PepSY domain-containing protein [Armatimonadota bacterium]
MKHKMGILIAIMLISTSVLSGSQRVYAQVPEMTADQARQALLPYVQAPDTTLTATATVDTDPLNGHTTYQFEGDTGGSTYVIDAATGEKDITYLHASTWDQVNNPNNPPPFLPTSQLLQNAIDFLAAHFPNYTPGMFQNSCDGSPATVADGDEYFLNFYALSPSGAWQPLHSMINVEEDTGRIVTYTEKAIPVTISTTPAISQAQAIQAGQTWIAQNLTTDPTAGDLQSTDALGGNPQVQFEVIVDPMLNETLVYQIMYKVCPLTIDAQSGAVIGQDEWLGGAGFHGAPKNPAKRREALWHVRLGPKVLLNLDHVAIQANGETYLWQNYLRPMGIRIAKHGGQLDLSKGPQRLRLRIRDNPKGTPAEAWKRQGSLYVPISAVSKLYPALVLDKQAQAVVLNVPAPPLSANVGPGMRFASPRKEVQGG